MWYDEAVVYQIYPLGLCGAPLQNSGDQTQAGEHRLLVQVNDDARVQGFTHERAETVRIRPGQVVLIDFVADRGGVVIR